jgi:phosphoribosylglycinamide formyltransferase-1
MKETELNLAMLISGGGTTMDAVLEAIEIDDLQNIRPVAVIASKDSAAGLKKAQIRGVPTFVINRSNTSKDQFGQRLLHLLQSLNVDLVSQNGWLPLTPEIVVEAYSSNNMLINQHPGPLDPGRGNDFGGRGMYGAAVTCARVAYLWMTSEDRYTESTVHSVTPNFDEGDLISVAQIELPMIPSYTIDPDDLQIHSYQMQLRQMTSQVQSMLLPLEHQNVIAALNMFGQGMACTHKRPEPLVPQKNTEVLEIAKNLAINMYPKG